MKQLRIVCQALMLLLGICLTQSAAASTGYMYSRGSLYTVDPDTGNVREIGPTVRLTALAFDPDHRLFGVGEATPTSNTFLYELDVTSGAATPVGDCQGTFSFWDLTIDSLGRIWAIDTDTLYSIDPSTGLATPVTVFGGYGGAIAARDQDLFIVQNAVSGPSCSWWVDLVDPSTGIRTRVLEEIVSCLRPESASFGAGGELRVSAASPGPIPFLIFRSFFRLDLDSGQVQETFSAATDPGDPLWDPRGLAMSLVASPATVDVPTLSPVASIALFALLAMLGAVASRRLR